MGNPIKDYVSVVYNEKEIPRTAYPQRLCAYLVDRFKIKNGAKLLEIGCGRGEFLEGFKMSGMDCYGVDLSDYCVRNKPSFVFISLDIAKEKLPFEDNTFDLVYHKSLLEHFYTPDNLMRETLRILKPGGKLIILTPDWKSQMCIFYEDFTHCRPYNVKALGDLLRVYGFRNVACEIFYQLPAIWKFHFLKVISRLLQAVLSVETARKLTKVTGIKFFRWSVELMVFGYGEK